MLFHFEKLSVIPRLSYKVKKIIQNVICVSIIGKIFMLYTYLNFKCLGNIVIAIKAIFVLYVSLLKFGAEFGI